MNQLKGHIVEINEFEGLNLIHIDVNGTIFKSIIIDNPKNRFNIQDNVNLLFKATEVVIATQPSLNISLQNQFECQIIELKKGKLLTDIKLMFESVILHSIITTDSTKKLELKESKTITACIKTNEILLEKC